ncbi:MAG: iron-sulfur cluster assembly accessory protein [Deltaproteobacteria bacterium]|nr:iron-sulfur cluster assembly accessory protein [Deltaproteobacteria bacterium]
MAIPAPITFGDEETSKPAEKVYNFDHGKALDLTPEAITQVKSFIDGNKEKIGDKKFRVYVEGGGCSGFQYGFTFDEQKDDDQVISCADIAILLDPASETYIKGSIVDHVSNENGTGFIVKNPQAKGECGCGLSFNV